MTNPLGPIGRAIAQHPGITAFAVGTTAITAATVASPDHKIGGLDLQVASAAAVAAGGITGIAAGIFGHGTLSAVGFGVFGAGLIGVVVNR